jgi:GDP-L-fucose synthase
MKTYSDEGIVNIGTGQDVPVAELARLVCEAVGYQGALRFDTSRPDGTPRKVVDVSRLEALGWTAKTSLKDGLALTYRWFLEHVASQKLRVA